MTNNDILIGHLGWDGCHFLGSCLSMSDEVYFNNFTLRGKVEYFFKGMANIEKVNGKPIWNDVFMFFGTSYQTEGHIHYRNVWINDVDNNFETFEFNSDSQQKTRVSRLHVPVYYPLREMVEKNISHPVVNMFKSRYFICLVNTHLFASLRSIKIENDTRTPDNWDAEFAIIPDVKWFGGPLTEIDEITNSITVSEFKSLPKDVQEKVKLSRNSNLEDLFNLTKLHKEDNDLLKTMITHQWDCNWFLTEEETIENIKRFYLEMDLGKCNEKLISEMYKVWIRKMDYLKKWHINDPDKSDYVSPIDNERYIK
jgi:hypothetical protein